MAGMDSSILKAVGFVHTHVHSAYSLREGAISVESLVKRARPTTRRRVALTDTNNLFGALEFSEKAEKAGVQPLIGAQLTVDFGDAAAGRAPPRLARAPLVLLARNERGLSQPDAARQPGLARSDRRRRGACALRRPRTTSTG